MLPLNLYARVRFSFYPLHARPRVQRAPGLPCALHFSRVRMFANLGRIAPRERGVVSINVVPDKRSAISDAQLRIGGRRGAAKIPPSE